MTIFRQKIVQQLSNANTSNGAALSGDCPTVVQRLSINNNINNISNTDVLESATADKKSDKKKPSVSCQDVVDAYHEILPEAPRIRALNDKRKNQIRTFWRKAGVITRQLDGHGFTMQDWRNYLSYVGENCRWMFEERPNHQRGTVWHKKGFDFLLNDNTYLKVREGARCRDCHGTGRAVDIAKTEQWGRVVEKECGRCKGVGYSRMPAIS